MHIMPYFFKGDITFQKKKTVHKKAGINTNTGNLPDLFPHPEGEACPS